MLVTTTKELTERLSHYRTSECIIGFVPTMGALHMGHLSLIANAYKSSDVVVVSIFVNPTQFNNASDLDTYPRNLEKDIAFVYHYYPNTIIFAPEISEMYQKGCQTEHFDFGNLAQVMEGKFRVGHFDGVGTIVKRLFNAVRPDVAFFGEKDYQQLAIIKRLVQITKQPVKIVGCPTEREANGLAKSSRNERLSKIIREEAKIIYASLNQVKLAFGSKTPEELKAIFMANFKDNTTFEVEYIQLAEDDTLLPVRIFEQGKKYRAFAAVFVDGVRLIDNIALN